ncbi:DUF2066 domain-containing protein [Halopseudomonas phragmitis]|nr:MULTISPECIES: DUF2066 domain-containing protein [Pseudomonadaceae]
MPVMRTALMILALLVPVGVSAAVLDDLYKVEVSGEEGQSREDQIRLAAAIVLERLAGPDLNLSRAPFAEALAEPRNLVRRTAAGADGVVDIEFEPSALRELLTRAALPMLGRNRPGVLLWGVEAGVLGDELLVQGAPWAELLNQAARQRAVALDLPLADLQDRSQVTESMIREASQESLLQASERYPSEAVLALAIAQQGETWQLNWTLWLNEQRDSGRVSDADQAQAADSLMRALAAAVFKQYAVSATPDGELQGWTLVVNGINGVNDYASLQRTLQQLGAQAAPRLLSVQGDRAVLAFDFSGTEAQLVRLLALDQRLLRVSAPIPEPTPQLVPQPTSLDELEPVVETAADEVGETVVETTTPSARNDLRTLYYRWQ